MTVHVLRHGLPLCGFSREMPALWPQGHRWVRREDVATLQAELKCQACARVEFARVYVCPRCERVSHNENDALHRYCGACHQFEAP